MDIVDLGISDFTTNELRINLQKMKGDANMKDYGTMEGFFEGKIKQSTDGLQDTKMTRCTINSCKYADGFRCNLSNIQITDEGRCSGFTAITRR